MIKNSEYKINLSFSVNSMKRFWILLLASTLLFSPAVFALWAPSNLEPTAVSGTSISLDWQDVANATWYYLYYGTTSGSWATYESEWIDLIENSETVLTKLNPETNYFFAVTSLDSAWVESDYSKELTYKTLKSGEQMNLSEFKIISVSVIDEETLEFQFSSELDASPNAVNEFAIQNRTTLKEIPIDISSVNENTPNKVLVILGEKLSPNSSFKVTVLDMTDAEWNSIESWINAFINFETTDFQSSTTTLKDDTASDSNSVQNPLPEPQASTVDDASQSSGMSWSVNAWNAGQNISQDEIANNTLEAAATNDALPETGPEHWILIFLASLFIGWIYFFNTQKHKI